MILRSLRGRQLQNVKYNPLKPISSIPRSPFPRTHNVALGRIHPECNLARRSFTSASKHLDKASERRENLTAPSLYAKPYRAAPRRNPDEPIYELTFTCKRCQTRSSHTVSKQGYHKGTVLIQCPGCKNRHLISDHLKIFNDVSTTIEDIMKENGELVRKGVIDEKGDVELWAEEEAEIQGKSEPK